MKKNISATGMYTSEPNHTERPAALSDSATW